MCCGWTAQALRGSIRVMTLYMVATPIGNLEDITFRAVRTMKEVDFLICEDTRRTGILCKEYGIETPRISFHAQSSAAKAEAIAERILNGETAAYVSDAGTPCLSDPGFGLVRAAVRAGVNVVPVPGPSALMALISVAGVPSASISWHGFVPHKKGRKTLIEYIAQAKNETHAMYESVHRMERLLREMSDTGMAERRVAIGRELTKKHEEIFRGTVAEAAEHFAKTGFRGEFVVFVCPEGFLL